MQRRRLGSSSLEISPLGLGTWGMGGDLSAWGAVDDNESVAAISQALDAGINLIDTAPIYGNGHSETIVGRAVHARRDRVLLATKCGLLPNGTREPRRCLAKDSVMRECEASLRRLQTDHIDVLQCHWPDPATPIRETMEALATLLRQGKTRAIGLSNYDCQGVAAALEFGPVHCVQAPFSLLQRRAAADLLPFCQEHGIGMLAYSPLAKGLLSGRMTVDSKISGVRSHDVEFAEPRFSRNLDLVSRLRPIAEENGKTVAQLALNWVVQQPGVTAALVGAKRPSQVIENAGAIGWTIEALDLQRIDALLRVF